MTAEQAITHWARIYTNKYNGQLEFDDLQQEARIAVWKAQQTFDSSKGVPFDYWAYRAIPFHLNTYCRTMMRQQKRKRINQYVNVEELDETPMEDIRLLDLEGQELLDGILEQLDSYQREALRMRLSGESWDTIKSKTYCNRATMMRVCQRLYEQVSS